MTEPRFDPGFRISVVDAIVIVVSTIGAIVLWPTAWWMGFVVAFVVAHFFLFCNVFRIARALELIWAGIFVALTYCTIMVGVPSWTTTIVCCLVATSALVTIEMAKPSYHGVFWKRINPNLPQWWERRNNLPQSHAERANQGSTDHAT